MIPAVIYFIACCLLIRYGRFFRESGISMFTLFLLFVLKCTGCFLYYWIYYVYYPDTFMCDTKSTMHDAGVIYSALPEHPLDFLKMVTGLHSDAENTSLYADYFHHMQKWHRQEDFEFFLNDNRTMTRINAVIMILSFGAYPVHALVMVVLSFIGQILLFKTFRPFFPGKGSGLLLAIFFAPSLFFWTSGVLKEPFTLLLLGLFLYSYFTLFIHRRAGVAYVAMLLVSFALFMVMKPYVLILVLFPLLTYTLVQYKALRRVALTYIVCTVLLLGGSMLILKTVFHKDVQATIVKRQNDFVNLSYGGRFFLNSDKYVRVEYSDSSMIQAVDASKKLYRFKPHSRYMYWKLSAIEDTVYVRDNADTSVYSCLSVITPAGSGIYYRRLDASWASIVKMIPYAYMNVLCKPLFYQTHSATELFASFENAFILLILLAALVFGERARMRENLFWFLLVTVLLSFLLIGLTTTVSGAIVRYKSIFLPFLLMMPLMLLREETLKKIPLLRALLKTQ